MLAWTGGQGCRQGLQPCKRLPVHALHSPVHALTMPWLSRLSRICGVMASTSWLAKAARHLRGKCGKVCREALDRQLMPAW